MATKKISELESINAADESDVLVIVDVSEGTTKKITKGNLLVGAGHSIEIQLNTQTYQLEFKLKNEQGTVLSTQTLDLPSENAVTNIEYNNGNLVLTKQSGGTSTVDISALISGLQSEITNNNKLSSDLVDDTNKTNKFTNETEKATWNGKYNKPSGGIPKTDLSSEVQTSLEKADSAIQDVSGKENKSVTGTDTNTYDTTETYNTGDIVVQSEKIYKCKQDNVTGTFDATKWDEISLYEYQKIQDGKLEDNYKEIIKLEQKVAAQKKIISQNPQVTDTDYEPTLADTIEAPFEQFEVKGHSEQTPLPEGYTILDYIQSSGTQYIDTGFVVTNKSKIEADIQFIDRETTQSNYNRIFGTTDNVSKKSLALNFASDPNYRNNLYFWNGRGFGNGEATVAIDDLTPEFLNAKHKYILDNTGLTIDGTLYQKTGEGNNGTTTIKIFTYDSDGSVGNSIIMKLYRFKIYDDNVLVRDFISCKNSSNEVGLYDLVTKTFFSNAGTGTFIAGDEAIIPTPDYPVPIKSCGENVQLLDESNLEVGSIDASTGQNVSSNLEFRTVGYIEVSKSTNYTLSNQNYIKYTHRGIFEYDENHNYIQRTNNQIISLKDGFALKTSSTTRYIRIRYIVGQSSSDVITEVPENMKIKIEQGTVATPWSPYGMGCVNEKVSSKNWFDKDKLIRGGTTNPNLANTVVCNCLKVITGNKISISRYNSNYSYAFVITDSPTQSTTANVLYSSGYKSNNSFDFTSSVNGYGYLQIKRTDETNLLPSEIKSDDFQVEQGSATSFVPHEEQNISIPTQQPMRSIEDVEDEFVLKNDGKWYERHNIGRVIFDGSNDEEWRFQGTWTTPSNRTVISKDNNLNNKYDNDYLSNMFIKEGSSTNRFVLTSSLYLSLDDSLAGITSNDDDSTRLTKVLTYMSTHNVVIQYELAEPTDILCTQAQSDILDSLTDTVHTYKGGTYITSPDEVKAKLSVSGLYDLNKLLTRIETLESEV